MRVCVCVCGSEAPYSTDEESDEEFDDKLVSQAPVCMYVSQALLDWCYRQLTGDQVSSMEERLGREHAAASQMDRQYEESHGGGEQVGGGSYTDIEDDSDEDDSDEL